MKLKFIYYYRTLLLTLAALLCHVRAAAQLSEGFFHIVSTQDNTYYLCPAQDPDDPSVGYWVDGNLMLTTKKNPPEAYTVWRIIGGSGDNASYNQIVHQSSGQYIINDKTDKVATTPLDEWIRFLKTGEIDDGTQVPGLPEARERLRVALLPEAEHRQYRRDMEDLMYQQSVIDTERIEGRFEGHALGLAEGHAKGLEEGQAKGRAEGRAEGLKEVAAKMKQMGMPVEAIVQATGLTADELSQL